MYEFAGCTLDPQRFELRRAGDSVHVEPQVFDVLVYLLRHRHRVVPKTELLDEVWGDRFVGESALASRMKAARRAVGDDGERQAVIKTVFARGYQFVADVVEVGVDAEPWPSGSGRPPAEPVVFTTFKQSISFCTTEDGTRIAYARSGDGPVLVKAANWMTHLDYDPDSAVWRHWLDELSRDHTLVRYDERGCGMSDHDAERFTFDAWVDDLAAVVDAAGLERFPLLGLSQGAAVAVAYAARHPERVERLVLFGAYGQGRLVRAYDEHSRRAAALDVEIARVGWGSDDPSFRQMFTSMFLPDGSREEWDQFNELQRRTTSAENAARFLEEFATIDVLDIAADVVCPTALFHSRDDHRVPLGVAQELAARIPGSRLVVLPSRNHILTNHEPAWPQFLEELNDFLRVS